LTPQQPRSEAPAPLDAPGEQARHGDATGSHARRLSSHELLAGGKEVEIDHEGAVYRLRLTSLGKLILTK
jgi:hemin uptake protein HemP